MNPCDRFSRRPGYQQNFSLHSDFGFHLGIIIGLLLFVISVAYLSYPAPSWAAQWHRVAETDQGQQQQFVDINSVQGLGQGRVRVNSYYLDRRSGQDILTTYVTEYDCQRRWFRDVQDDGPVSQGNWQPVDPDPLNAAALEYACAQLGYSTGHSSSAENRWSKN